MYCESCNCSSKHACLLSLKFSEGFGYKQNDETTTEELCNKIIRMIFNSIQAFIDAAYIKWPASPYNIDKFPKQIMNVFKIRNNSQLELKLESRI